MPERGTTAGEGRLRLSGFLRGAKAEVIARWSTAVRASPAAPSLPLEQVIDHLPEVLDELAERAEALDRGEPFDAELENQPETRRHALHRLSAGVPLEEVIAEYAILRGTLMQVFLEQHPGSMEQLQTLSQVVDLAVHASVVTYSRARERTLIALERLSHLAAESNDLEVLLPRMLRVMAETSRAVDVATIFLWDGERLRAHAALGLEEEIAQGFSLGLDEGFAGRVARERRPLALRHAAADPVVRSTLIRERGTRALFGIPMLEGDELVGVAYMGSTTAFEFTDEERILFQAMANRAGALLYQRQLLAKRRRAEAIADLVFEATPIGLAVLDRELRYVRANDALCRMNAVPCEATVGKQIREVIPELAEKLEPLFRKMLEGGEPVVGLELTGPRGHTAEPGAWLVSYYPLHSDGQIFGIGAVVLDITDRRRIAAALAEGEARKSAILDAALDCVVTIDDNSRVLEWNPASERTFGIPRAQALGRELPELIIPPELREAHRRGVERYLATGKGPLIGRRVEIEGMRADGSRIPVELAITAIEVGGKRTFTAYLRDLTDRREAEREREELIGILSHDLRNPVAVVTTSAEYLLKQGGLNDKQVRTLARISNGAERANRMIRDLLDLTRSRHGGGLPVNRRPVDAYLVARHVAEELEVVNPDRKIAIEALGDTRGEWDPDRLAQLVQNLVSNALTYGDAAEPVKVIVRGQGEHVDLEVSNRGPAIPPAVLPHLWEPFRRGAAQGEGTRGAGLGLGLYIVQQIVKSHGGSATVRSDERETAFSIRLPRKG
jgi:PAS domain S-box-containing protein